MTRPDKPGPTIEWYASRQQVSIFARILVASGVLLSVADVVDYFEEPWKRVPEYHFWDHADRPLPSSQDDLAEVRMLGGGPAAHDFERRHSHDQ